MPNVAATKAGQINAWACGATNLEPARVMHQCHCLCLGYLHCKCTRLVQHLCIYMHAYKHAYICTYGCHMCPSCTHCVACHHKNCATLLQVRLHQFPFVFVIKMHQDSAEACGVRHAPHTNSLCHALLHIRLNFYSIY